MQQRSINPVYSREFANLVALAFLTAPADPLVDAMEVHLFQGEDFNPTPDSVSADFVAQECDFTTYAAKAAVVLTGPVNVDADVQGMDASVQWTVNAPVTTANDVKGYWIETGTTVVCYEKFTEDVPVIIDAENDFLQLQVILPVQIYQSAAQS